MAPYQIYEKYGFVKMNDEMELQPWQILPQRFLELFLVVNQNQRHRTQKKDTPREMEYPSCGQTRKPSVGFVWLAMES